MTKVLYLDYTALIMYALMFATYFIRIRKSSLRRGVFSLLLTVAALATVYDICAVQLDNRGSGAVVLKYIMHSGYLILRNLITPIFGAYVISVTDTWHKLYKKHIIQFLIWIPFALVVILTLSSPFTHLVFYLDENDAYTRGPLFFILYLSALFYTCFCLYYAIKSRKILKFERFVPLFSIAPNQIIAVAVQFFYPHILCEMAATALCMLLVILMIERPEEKIDHGTGLYKAEAFYEMVLQSSEVDKPYSFVLINVTKHSAINSYISFANINELYGVIAERLTTVRSRLGTKADLYNLENGLFAAVFYYNEARLAPLFSSQISDELKKDCNIGRFAVSILSNVGVANVPEDIKTIDEIRFICKAFRNEKYTGEILVASEIVKTKNYLITANIDGILKNAISNNEFDVYYQPIYSNVDNRFNSAEALIRLNTAAYGFISPDLFIPLAEESGMIHEIGMIVFEKVCSFIASDEYKKLGLDYIEVNLSTVQCMDSNLTDKIMTVIKKYNIDPSQINLEITETASGLLQKNMLQNINNLHNNGFSFSLDDFGTGYSNMVRISALPLHIVKLDKSLTWTEGNNRLKLILDNTIKMIKRLDMRIVVEGVETKEMLDSFAALGCEYIQGYYFSKPLPKDGFVEYISNNL